MHVENATIKQLKEILCLILVWWQFYQRSFWPVHFILWNPRWVGSLRNLQIPRMGHCITLRIVLMKACLHSGNGARATLQSDIPKDMKFRVHRICLWTALLSVLHFAPSSFFQFAKPLLSTYLTCPFDSPYQTPVLAFMTWALITISLLWSNNWANDHFGRGQS